MHRSDANTRRSTKLEDDPSRKRPKHVMLSARPLLDAPPGSDQLTDYDHEHFATYLFLLDCALGNKDWRDAMTQLIGDDSKTDPDKAKTMYDSHLARAQWMSRTGHRQLLRVLSTKSVRH
jgi:hypothetical protein